MNHEQLDGANDLNDRASRWIFMAVGHLKAGVGRAQAITDLNSIGSYLEKTYPQDERHMSFLLGRPGTWIPARRALSGNPMILLREE